MIRKYATGILIKFWRRNFYYFINEFYMDEVSQILYRIGKNAFQKSIYDRQLVFIVFRRYNIQKCMASNYYFGGYSESEAWSEREI